MGPPAQPAVLAAAGDGSRRWVSFGGFRGIVAAATIPDVVPALAELRRQTAAGRVAAGFICYEAARAFDEALATRRPGALPLLWFALYDRAVPAPPPPPPAGPFAPPAWRSTLAPAEYAGAFAAVKRRIAAGETYQVNYTYRLRAPWRGDAAALFAALVREQGARYGILLDAGPFAVLSASPELFLRRRGDRVLCRPMKGTAPRGASPSADRHAARRLRSSEKERAENVMIVDMVRNDLGRVARTGTVRVPRLFTVEGYPSVWQMTSTVTAETAATLEELLGALFPSASITGAPKVRTSRIIAGLEGTPRGVYCGAAGVLGPGRRAWLNVAIRTVTLDRRRGRAEYGTGSGLVWDSAAATEALECRAKTLLRGGWERPFELLETAAWLPGRGVLLLDRHLARLRAAARRFGYPLDGGAVRSRLREATRGLPRRPHRLRLLVDEAGGCRVEAHPLPAGAGRLALRPPRRAGSPLRVAFAASPVERDDPFLHHKTTRRGVYERALASRPGCDEVLLWNASGEVTEAATANLVVRIGGRLWTPPVASGLLAGTFRALLLERGAVSERALTRAEVAGADEVWLVNSVRGWRRCRLAAASGGGA